MKYLAIGLLFIIWTTAVRGGPDAILPALLWTILILGAMIDIRRVLDLLSKARARASNKEGDQPDDL